MIVNLEKLEMKPHPKFEGVKIGFITTKEKTPELSITLLEIEKEVAIPIHTHEKEVDTIFILEGEGILFLDDNEYKVKKGDVIVIQAGKKHGIKNTGDVPLKCYIVHAPALW